MSTLLDDSVDESLPHVTGKRFEIFNPKTAGTHGPRGKSGLFGCGGSCGVEASSGVALMIGVTLDGFLRVAGDDFVSPNVLKFVSFFRRRYVKGTVI